jgi:hypothetical protein
MCLSCGGLVVGCYVTFYLGLWLAVMCISCRGLVPGSYVPFWYVVDGR